MSFNTQVAIDTGFDLIKNRGNRCYTPGGMGRSF